MPSAKSNKNADRKEPRQIQNRRARYDYEILKTFEAGIALAGSEVKSVFLGRANLSDAYCRIKSGEVFLHNLDIEPYEFAGYQGHERRRDRKLLLHRKEIGELFKDSEERGLTLVPLRLYFAHGKVKVEVAVGRGKKSYDKRDAIASREAKRAVEKTLAEHRRTGRAIE